MLVKAILKNQYVWICRFAVFQNINSMAGNFWRLVASCPPH